MGWWWGGPRPGRRRNPAESSPPGPAPRPGSEARLRGPGPGSEARLRGPPAFVSPFRPQPRQLRRPARLRGPPVFISMQGVGGATWPSRRPPPPRRRHAGPRAAQPGPPGPRPSPRASCRVRLGWLGVRGPAGLGDAGRAGGRRPMLADWEVRCCTTPCRLALRHPRDGKKSCEGKNSWEGSRAHSGAWAGSSAACGSPATLGKTTVRRVGVK